jgi:hypothetical protein
MKAVVAKYMGIHVHGEFRKLQYIKVIVPGKYWWARTHVEASTM